MNTLRLNRIALAMREKVAETGWQNAGNAYSAWRENNTAMRQRGDDHVGNAVAAWRENNTANRQRGDDRVGNAVAGWFGGAPAGRAAVAPPTAPTTQSAAPTVPARAPTPVTPASSSAPVRSSGVGAAMGAKDAARFSAVAPASQAAPAGPAAPVDTTPALAHDMTTSRLEASIKRNAAPAAPTAQTAPAAQAAPAAGGEKKQFSSYWQMAKAMNEGVTDPSKRVSAAELSKKFDGKMIRKGDSFDLDAIRGGTYAGASGAKGSFDKWQAARTAKADPNRLQLTTGMNANTFHVRPGREGPPAQQGSIVGGLTPPPSTLAEVGGASSRVAQAPRITTPGGGTPPPGATGVLGTPPPMRSAPVVRSPGEQARTAAAVANARQQVRQGSTASSDTIANNALSATKPLVPQLQTQLGNRPVPRS